jgi:hypothetical protein
MLRYGIARALGGCDMIDIVIPSIAPYIFLDIIIWLIFAIVIGIVFFISGFDSFEYCFIYGVIVSGFLIIFLLILQSLFTNSPLPIQIVNISWGG